VIGDIAPDRVVQLRLAEDVEAFRRQAEAEFKLVAAAIFIIPCGAMPEFFLEPFFKGTKDLGVGKPLD